MVKQNIDPKLIKLANKIVNKYNFGEQSISSSFLRNLMDNALIKKPEFFKAYVYYQLGRSKVNSDVRKFCEDVLKEINTLGPDQIIQFLNFIIWLAKYKEKFKTNPII
ncbi:MAG: hypothetical protein ACTSRP_13485 [Candidatus Helarchaeota archaeon]